MDTNTGHILTPEQVKAMKKALGPEPLPDHIRMMELDPTPKQLRRNPPRVGRNEPCPCGSGLKFKRCCYTGE